MHIQSNSTLNKTFSCPVCKHEYNVPLRGVSGFQKSFVVEQFRDVLMSTESDSSWSTNSKEAGIFQEYPMCQSHPTEDLQFFCNVNLKYVGIVNYQIMTGIQRK